MKIQVELQAGDGNTAGFQLPDEFVDNLGGGGRPKVTAQLNGFSWRSSIARMGGEYWLGMSIDRRAEAGATPGTVYDLDVELDTAPRVVELPDDLAAALAEHPDAEAFWATVSPSNQGYHVGLVTGAKKPETRASRVDKIVALMRAGKAR